MRGKKGGKTWKEERRMVLSFRREHVNLEKGSDERALQDGKGGWIASKLILRVEKKGSFILFET